MSAPPTSTEAAGDAAGSELSPAPARRRWSDPATWGAHVPGVDDIAEVDGPVVLDVDATTAGVVIREGGSLVFDETTPRTLTSTGNVVVRGLLVMRPSSPAIVHTLRFARVDERRFQGGGTEPLDTDVGLWVVGAGQLDLVGAARRSWTRVRGELPSGTADVALVDAPSGWQPGDDLAITPTVAPVRPDHASSYDVASVAAVATGRVRLDRPLRYAHPAVDTAAGAMTAEVLNLTRNVRVEGTSSGRAHVFICSQRPQVVRHVAFRHLGPRKASGTYTEKVLGRYVLHFHMAGDGVRGSIVEGVVARECGSHAFVTHLSNGVTYRDCISHDTLESPYWWDGAPDTRTPGPPSHAVRYERCVASWVKSDPAFRGFRLTGFALGRGDGNSAVECVSVGIQGNRDASGFQWPEGSEGVWTFERCVSHNNAVNGVFVWQNTQRVHVIRGFVAYHCGAFGISHGAYDNQYRYEDCALLGNRDGAIALHAVGGSSFVRLVCDGAGSAPFAVVSRPHTLAPAHATRFEQCRFAGYTTAALGVMQSTGERDAIDLVSCVFAGNELWLGTDIDPDSVVRVVDGTRDVNARRRDQRGTPYPPWNASVT